MGFVEATLTLGLAESDTSEIDNGVHAGAMTCSTATATALLQLLHAHLEVFLANELNHLQHCTVEKVVAVTVCKESVHDRVQQVVLYQVPQVEVVLQYTAQHITPHTNTSSVKWAGSQHHTTAPVWLLVSQAVAQPMDNQQEAACKARV
jgi:hypothetical protein